ncbi:hypothetical protein [Gelidibacter maritimus]|uniref:Uncharacterized protein n=1 Tax=Gelidibacter maritimus TaxID=2761487 RepID=A0A7W2M8S2_9FLAO|nr:hypothetical protein [Gelidibacter maritimus]MBA6154758.1 hypothetical protein [Gelidibacter maritimus]
MKVFKAYWWLLLILIVVTIVFILGYKGVMPELLWTDKPLDVLGGLFAKLLIVGALLDQFIALFFPPEPSTVELRQAAEIRMTHLKEEQEMVKKQLFYAKLNKEQDPTIDLMKINSNLSESIKSKEVAANEIERIDGERSKRVRMIAFGVGLILAITGITTLTDFIIMPEDSNMLLNHKILSYYDIIFTAAILSGGTSGIHQLSKVVRDSWRKS